MRSKLKINQRADEAIKSYLQNDQTRLRQNKLQFMCLKDTITYHRNAHNHSYLSIYKGLRFADIIDYSYSTFMRFVNKYIERQKSDKIKEPTALDASRNDEKIKDERLSDKVFHLSDNIEEFI